jgi:hypothetical protein
MEAKIDACLEKTDAWLDIIKVYLGKREPRMESCLEGI